MHVLLEQHEIEEIAENLQAEGVMGIEDRAIADIAEAISVLLQARLDALVDPRELLHLITGSELQGALNKLSIN